MHKYVQKKKEKKDLQFEVCHPGCKLHRNIWHVTSQILRKFLYTTYLFVKLIVDEGSL